MFGLVVPISFEIKKLSILSQEQFYMSKSGYCQIQNNGLSNSLRINFYMFDEIQDNPHMGF